MFNKYKYHHQVLVYLNNKRNKYLEHLESNKASQTKLFGFHFDTFSAQEISSDLKLDSVKIKETLVDLHELGFINFENFRYNSKENTITYIDSQYFKNKRKEYLERRIIDILKNTIIIIVGIISIYTFIRSTIIDNNLTEKKILEIESKIKIIEQEQIKQNLNEKIIIKDSLL